MVAKIFFTLVRNTVQGISAAILTLPRYFFQWGKAKNGTFIFIAMQNNVLAEISG
jgi:hypothetical protein